VIFTAFRTEVGYAVIAGLALALVLLVLLPADRRMIGRSIAFLLLSLVAETLASAFKGMGAGMAANLAGTLAAITVGVVLIRLAFLFFFSVILRIVRLQPPRILEDIAFALAVITWGLVWLRMAGVDFSSLVTTSAVITAVVAFSMQETLGSILGGLALQLDRSIRVGDWVRFDDVSGRVVELRWRYTAVETRNHETVYLPNGQLTKQRFTVIGSRSDPAALWRRWVWINVDLSAPPTRVCETLERAIRQAEIPYVAHEPPPQCALMDFVDHGGRYAIRYWLTNPAADDPTDSQVREHALAAITRAGMHLALPYQKRLVTKENEHLRSVRHAGEMQRRLVALSKVEILAELTAEELTRVAEHLVYAPFVQGDTIIRQGAVAHWLYLVIDGDVDVWVEVAAGERLHIGMLGSGSVLGEMGMMTGEPRTATVTARGDVECYRLDKSGFHEVIHSRPDIAERISEVLAERKTGLEAALEKARAEARPPETHADILERIRNFFGLTDTLVN
jgi:small-conductance mechanosensitive channel/CRP-like cAMP-binding protein